MVAGGAYRVDMDVFLFDPLWNLVYTVYKERDFATNIETGEWRDTGLAGVFRGARDAATTY